MIVEKSGFFVLFVAFGQYSCPMDKSWFFFSFCYLIQVKKRQQRVLMILDSKNIKYEVIDIAEPGKESDKEFMQEKSTNKGGTTSDGDPRHALPPQIFSDDEYCGKYGRKFLDLTIP